jgi:hypothetical protein
MNNPNSSGRRRRPGGKRTDRCTSVARPGTAVVARPTVGANIVTPGGSLYPTRESQCCPDWEEALEREGDAIGGVV